MRLLLGRLEFQSTLLQEERLSVCIIVNYSVIISIHAPTRGATGILLIPAYKHSIFQSTLLQEERLFSHVIYNLLVKFQSTLLQEERPGSHRTVSTFQRHFNPRSYKRSDPLPHLFFAPMTLFQSTLLQEERRLYISIHHHRSYFNPRSYKRSDYTVFSVL